MRDIKGIIIHCSATKPSMDIGVTEITDWHVNPKLQRNGSYKYKGKPYKNKDSLPNDVKNLKGNGWSDIGYHYVINRGGLLELGRDIKKNGAHTKGHNTGTIGICIVGGVDDTGEPKSNYTPNQWQTLENLLTTLVFEDYMISGFYIKGHNQFSSKACPSFDVQEYLETIGLGG